MFGNIEILGIVQIRVESILYAVDYSGFQVDEESSGNVMFIICLVEKDIFSVITLSSIFFKNAFRIDSMFHTKLFPEFVSNYKLW